MLQCSPFDTGLQPRIMLVNLPIQNERIEDSKAELNSDPNIQIGSIQSHQNLNDCFNDIGCLKIGGNNVFFLVCRKQDLTEIDKITAEEVAAMAKRAKLSAVFFLEGGKAK